MKEFKINTIKPYLSHNLNVGDVFFGEPEFINGRWKNSKMEIIEVGFKTKNECQKTDDIIETMFSKGKVFQFPKTINLEKIDDSRAKSMWVVEKVTHRIKFQGLHGEIPESLIVTARKIQNNKYNKKNELIEFVTIGRNEIDKKFEIIGNIQLKKSN
jgi:hypothetical protein